MTNQFQVHELFVINGTRVIEYTTPYGVRRFDIQPWKGERTLVLPVEISPGRYEYKTYSIEIYVTPTRQIHTSIP